MSATSERPSEKQAPMAAASFPLQGFGGQISRSFPEIGLFVIDSALPEALYNDLLDATKRLYWRYGWRATNPLARYWHHSVADGSKDSTEDVSARVRKHPLPVFASYLDWFQSCLPRPATLLRFYLNAHTYGTDGSPHTDTERPGEHTVICYLTDKWEPEWAGETTLFDKDMEVQAAVMPRQNRLIVFPSDLLHGPRPLAREFLGLRVVLVMKVRLES